MRLELIITEKELNDLITALDKAALYEFCTHRIKRTKSYNKLRDMLIKAKKCYKEKS